MDDEDKDDKDQDKGVADAGSGTPITSPIAPSVGGQTWKGRRPKPTPHVAASHIQTSYFLPTF